MSASALIFEVEYAGLLFPVISDSTIILFFASVTILNNPGCPLIDRIPFNIRSAFFSVHEDNIFPDEKTTPGITGSLAYLNLI
jgi:hypothetical protein